MKIYALKYKDEIVRFSKEEYDLEDHYMFNNEKIKDKLKIVTGTFTEE